MEKGVDGVLGKPVQNEDFQEVYKIIPHVDVDSFQFSVASH